MLGLVISDSFKAVVTIYILIPFLVIPNIILSGVIVKFEKLNPNISSPVAIPFYGDFITARWGYEALAVNQFIYNKFENQFYPYDKKMSKAKFKKDYWNVEIKGRLENILNDLKRGSRSTEFNDKLLVVYNEFRKEGLSTPDLKFEFTQALKPDIVSIDIVTAALKYVESLRKHYIDDYNNARDSKDAIVTKFQSDDNSGFLKLRDNYANESLEEFVTNKNESSKIITFKGEIIQKLEPIYMDPKFKFIRAHFYSPTKQIFGKKLDTFVVNVIVLWVITILLYLVLYFRLLKKLLESGEVVIGRNLKNSD